MSDEIEKMTDYERVYVGHHALAAGKKALRCLDAALARVAEQRETIKQNCIAASELAAARDAALARAEAAERDVALWRQSANTSHADFLHTNGALKRAQVDNAALRAERDEWVRGGARVGVTCVGRMQQAKHMADAAVEALGLVWDETAPSDIRDGITPLRVEVERLRADNTRLYKSEAAAWDELRAAKGSFNTARRKFERQRGKSVMPELQRLQSHLAAAEALLSKLSVWADTYGAALKPSAGASDTYGDGVRSCKAQVRSMLNAFLSAQPAASAAPCTAEERAVRNKVNAMVDAWLERNTPSPQDEEFQSRTAATRASRAAKKAT